MLTFYTVRVRKNGHNYPVDYIDPQTWEKRRFECDEPFSDPGDASGEFQAWASVHLKECDGCQWLEPAQFAGKLQALRVLKAEKERCVKDYWLAPQSEAVTPPTHGRQAKESIHDVR